MRYVTRVAVQEGTEVRDASGGVTYAYADVTNLGSVPATILPYEVEGREERYTMEEQYWNIILSGHYPDITTKMAVLHEGTRYLVDRVQTTLLRKQTVLRCRATDI